MAPARQALRKRKAFGTNLSMDFRSAGVGGAWTQFLRDRQLPVRTDLKTDPESAAQPMTRIGSKPMTGPSGALTAIECFGFEPGQVNQFFMLPTHPCQTECAESLDLSISNSVPTPCSIYAPWSGRSRYRLSNGCYTSTRSCPIPSAMPPMPTRRRNSDKFASMETVRARHGCPVLVDTMGWIEGVVEATGST